MSDAIEPPYDSLADAMAAWVEHDNTHEPNDPPCDRCRQLDAIVTGLRDAE